VNPYYEQDGVTIYHGDCREIGLFLSPADSIITDPVWPNADPRLVGADDPLRLFVESMDVLCGKALRLVIQLGCDSDPRFLTGVSGYWPFFRVCWLEYVRPNYKGRLLYTGDVAYAFGEPPPSRRGRHVISGRCLQNDSAKVGNGHPCPRQLAHAKWLVQQFANGTVLDPFCGSGTTLVAAKEAGYEAIGIEIEERYCEIAANRLSQGFLFGAIP
jgi:site-specific DNA-methyltransferase (adenine-specific)